MVEFVRLVSQRHVVNQVTIVINDRISDDNSPAWLRVCPVQKPKRELSEGQSMEYFFRTGYDLAPLGPVRRS